MNDLPVTFAEAEEILAATLPNYESRPQQQAFAQAVERALHTGGNLLAEAGCGTGKSLGALIPSILSGERVVYSTATKALQDQIANKDLPFLEEHLGVPFSHAVLKGRSNYICESRLADASPADVGCLDRIHQHIADHDVRSAVEVVEGKGGITGERDSFPFAIEDDEWRKVTITTDECPGKRDCPFGETCYAERAKARAKAADVVVVNHALFFTDLRLRMETDGAVRMLGDFGAVVLDEGHEVQDWATSAFSTRLTQGTFNALVTEVLNFCRKNDADLVNIEMEASMLNTAVAELWSEIPVGRVRQANIVEYQDIFVSVSNGLTDLLQALRAAGPKLASLDVRSKAQYERLIKRVANAEHRFVAIVMAPDDELVRWVEEEQIRGGRGRGTTRKSLHAAPISVAKILNEGLFSMGSVVVASATMSVGGDFDFIADNLGVVNYEAIDVGTPFDYGTQSMLYVPEHLPEPGPRTREAWQSAAINEMRELVNLSKGGALILFTSISDMRRAYETLERLLPYTCMMQGQGSNREVLERFTEDGNAVLFATKSFFTGVDVQGDGLRLVVIAKLPFPVPTEPMTEARCEAIKAKGGNDFGDYTIPVMSLILKQGFGRLIRHRDDRGVVAILDSRIESKGYGKKIVRALPPARYATKIEAVEQFMGGAS